MRSSWICVDANLVIRLVADPKQETVRKLWEQWSTRSQPLAAPALLYYEVTNALYLYEKQKLLSPTAVRLALRSALALPLRLYDEVDLHAKALEIARRLSLPAAYDAHYLALAEQLGAQLWTADRRLANAVSATLKWVHLVSV